MGKIHRLDQHMVNMIAAGEVIERPASVVKELMENSMDAGASRISVAVEDGGRKEIRITDNGMGMAPDDLALAFDTHATSKIQSSQDLRAIDTLGFRGEALASVASIAQVKTVTRSADSESAYSLEIDCGQRGPVTPASGPVGTTITVRDLFYKLPARRKFLRSAPTEMGHISEQFIRIGLGSLALQTDTGVKAVDFSLHHNGRELYRLDGRGDLRARVQTLLPMLATEAAHTLIDLKQEDNEIQIEGLLGHPDLARGNSKFQYVFLNGRFIRDKTITHAIKEAYRGLLEPNRYPVVFLFLTLPREDYDVNVHPTKTEVRFYHGNRIHSQVLGCVRERLLGVDTGKRGTVPRAQPHESMAATPVSKPERQHVREAMGDFFRNQRARADTPRAASPGAAYAITAPPDTRTKTTSASTVPLESDTVARRYLQVHDSYIVAEVEDGFIIIDQHALHEKILYERLCTQLAATGLTSQRLLIPQPVSLSESQAQQLEKQADLLGKLGIEVVPFGPGTYAVQAFPTLLQKADPVDFIQQLVDVLEENRELGPDRVLDAVLSMAACKAAIKAHQSLGRAEIEQLLADGRTAESSERCPHGRPTTLRFTLQELSKQFLRT